MLKIEKVSMNLSLSHYFINDNTDPYRLLVCLQSGPRFHRRIEHMLLKDFAELFNLAKRSLCRWCV